MALVIRTSERLPWWRDLDPLRSVTGLWRQRQLIYQLIRREVNGRYRGSLLGTLWMVLLPIFAVMIYTFVFGWVLKQRWPGMESGDWTYPLVIWAGLSIFTAFAEVVQRATTVICAQPNLVKKVVFPLEALPVMLVGTSLVPLAISMLVVCAGFVLYRGQLPNFLLIFAALSLFLIWLQGVAWFLAGVGTFLRDLGPMIQGLCPLVLFLTPIFYPLSAVPSPYRDWGWLNPLCVIVETVRSALLDTELPPTWALMGCVLICLATWQCGILVFTRLRSEMADVV